MEMTHFDVTLWSWNSPAPSAGNTGFYLSTPVSAIKSGPKPGWLQNLGTNAGMCVLWQQRLEAVPHWHMGKYITKCHRRSSWSLEKAVTCKHKGERTSLWNLL